MSVVAWPSRSSLSLLRLDAAAARNAQESAHDYLSMQFQLAAADFSVLDQRRAVARTLDRVDGREVATFGVVRIRVPAAYYVEQLRNIVGFKVGEAVLQIGAFSTPASVEDVSRPSLDAREVESLRRCRPGTCTMQLSDAALRRFQQEVPWRSPRSMDLTISIRRWV